MVMGGLFMEISHKDEIISKDYLKNGFQNNVWSADIVFWGGVVVMMRMYC
jgi:hypothetical protein